MLMQNFGVTNKEHYGMLWNFWSGQLTLCYVWIIMKHALIESSWHSLKIVSSVLITGLSRGLTDRLCFLHYRGFLILKPSRETLHPYLLEHLSKTHTWNWSHTLIPLFISYLEVNIKRTLFNPNTSTLKADNEKSSEVLLRLIYSSQVYLVTV